MFRLFSLTILVIWAGMASAEEESLEEINRKLENPLSDIWGLTIQNNYVRLKGDAIDGERNANTFLFQPFMPIPIGDNRMFTIRPVFPFVRTPVLDSTGPDGTDGYESGFGDMQVVTLYGPSNSDGAVWGVGATFKLPTAADISLGQEKYQVGPAMMFFSLVRPWTLGLFVQHWESVAGEDDRNDTSQTDIQYIIRRGFPGAWSLGMGPTISIDWEAESGNKVDFPIGLGITKTVRLLSRPVKLRLELQYSIVRPDDIGTDWNLRFQMTPVFKNPFM